MMATEYKLNWNMIIRLILIFTSIGTTYYLIGQAKTLQDEWYVENNKRKLINEQSKVMISFLDEIYSSWDKKETPPESKSLKLEEFNFKANRILFTNSNFSLQTPILWCKPIFSEYKGLIVASLDRSSYYYDISEIEFKDELKKIELLTENEKSKYIFPFNATPLEFINKNEYKKLKASREE